MMYLACNDQHENVVNGPVCRDLQAVGGWKRRRGESVLWCGETTPFLWRELNLQLSRKLFQPDFIYPQSHHPGHLSRVGTERFRETSREAWLQVSTLLA
jgi:hypothetical protein